MQTGWTTIQFVSAQLLADTPPTDAAEITGLTAGGWAMMLGSITLVTALCVFCIVRIFSESKPSEHHHVPLDINTDDLKLP
jgi:hypothetical protein